MASTTAELLWLSYLLQECHVPVKFPLTLFCDNSTQLLATNPCFHDKCKHFSIDFNFTRDQIQIGFLQTTHIPSSSQLAYHFTKSLPPKPHSLIFSKLEEGGDVGLNHRSQPHHDQERTTSSFQAMQVVIL